MDGLSSSFYILSIAGMCKPVTFKSKKANFFYFIYRSVIAIVNLMIGIFEVTLMVQSILSHKNVKEYNEGLYLSMTGFTSLAKFFITGIFNLQNLFNLKELTVQKNFQAIDDAEIKLEKYYENIIKFVFKI